MYTNGLLQFFLVGKCQEFGIEAGRSCSEADFWFYLYIRTFTNVLLHFFLIGNDQELGIVAGRYFK
jgi:hypothetical protein